MGKHHAGITDNQIKIVTEHNTNYTVKSLIMSHYKDFGFTFRPCWLNNILVKPVHFHHLFVLQEDPSIKNHNFSGLSTAQLKKRKP